LWYCLCYNIECLRRLKGLLPLKNPHTLCIGLDFVSIPKSKQDVNFSPINFQRIDCAIEFFRFLLKEKSELLELENLVIIQEIYYRKKKLLYDVLYEVPIRNSDEKIYFLLEHKSRRSNDFQIQMMKYKQVIHKWQKKEFGKLSSIIPVLFYQGLEIWDPEGELKGKMEKALETARKMKDEGFNPEQIIRITGLSKDQLKENGIL